MGAGDRARGASRLPERPFLRILCSSVGNCMAVGYFYDSDDDQRPMAATETSGSWGQASQIAPPSNAGSDPQALSGISCSSTGNCAAAGYYTDTDGNLQGQVATETSGSWAQATEVTAPANAGTNPDALFNGGISCASSGTCTAAGTYHDSSGHQQAMVATEISGSWAQAIEITAPGRRRSRSPGPLRRNLLSVGGRLHRGGSLRKRLRRFLPDGGRGNLGDLGSGNCADPPCRCHHPAVCGVGRDLVHRPRQLHGGRLLPGRVWQSTRPWSKLRRRGAGDSPPG